ncbi:MAG: class I SAM-dependent methyltransferase [Thiohalomonadales bacterium]
MQEDQFNLHADLENCHWWFMARRHILQDQISLCMQGQTGIIAEIGCGTGGNLQALESLGWKTIGVDTNATAITYAKTKVHGTLYHGLANTALAPHWPDIDMLLLADVLEHVEDDVTFLQEGIDHLKRGAFIVISVPALQLLWSQHDVILGHYRRYSYANLTTLISKVPNIQLNFMSYFNAMLLPVIGLTRLSEKIIKPKQARVSDLQEHCNFSNRLLYSLFSVERPFLRNRIRLPIGASLLCVLQKI